MVGWRMQFDGTGDELVLLLEPGRERTDPSTTATQIFLACNGKLARLIYTCITLNALQYCQASFDPLGSIWERRNRTRSWSQEESTCVSDRFLSDKMYGTGFCDA